MRTKTNTALAGLLVVPVEAINHENRVRIKQGRQPTLFAKNTGRMDRMSDERKRTIKSRMLLGMNPVDIAAAAGVSHDTPARIMR